MHAIELETPSGIDLLAQVVEPLASEPRVVLASASPVVGELLGEDRIRVRHSATPRVTSDRTRGVDCHPRSLTDPWSTTSTDATLELHTRTAASMRSRDDR